MTAHYEVRGDVAVITLDNPPVNGLGYATRVALAAGVNRAEDDPAVRAIVVTGAGKAFSGGADIKEFGSPKATSEPNLLSLIAQLEACSKPTVAAVHSVCMGGGLELALGCHYRVAAPGANVALPEVKIGLVPGAGGTQRLPRAIGKAKAMDLCLSARVLDADEADLYGLVSRVVPDDELHGATLALAERIAGYSLPALMAIKEAVNRSYESTLAEGVLFERRQLYTRFASEDAHEGMHAFLAKRPPEFKHR